MIENYGVSKEKAEKQIKELNEMIKKHRKDHKLDDPSTSDYVKMMRDPSDLEMSLLWWETRLSYFKDQK